MGCGSSKSTTVVSPSSNGKAKVQNGTPSTKDHKTANGVSKTQDSNLISEAEKENMSNSVKDEESKSKASKASLNDRVNSEKEIEKRDLTKDELHKQGPRSNMGNGQGVSSPVLSPVAFEVPLKEGSQVMKRPHRLQKLEKVTVLTAEQLAQKQAAAEENRRQELEKKKKKTSKRRKDLIEARELDKSQQQKGEIEEKISVIEKNRERAKAEAMAKQRRREEKARRVRERAKEIHEGKDMVDFEVDCDDTFNAADDSDEDWDLDNVSPQNASHSTLQSPAAAMPNDEEEHGVPEHGNEVHDFFK